jgi:hypothetical protein
MRMRNRRSGIRRRYRLAQNCANLTFILDLYINEFRGAMIPDGKKDRTNNVKNLSQLKQAQPGGN